MGLKELHPCWPDFKDHSKHYICMYQIDGKGSVPLYGNKRISYAHKFIGNLARYWMAEYGTAIEVGESFEQKGIWCLQSENRRIKLTVEYIDPQEIPPVQIHDTKIDEEFKPSGFSEQTKDCLEFLRQKL